MNPFDRISAFEAGAIVSMIICGVINYVGPDVNLIVAALILLVLSLLFE